jgi:hypothetical protein
MHFSFAQIHEELNMLRVWEVLSYDSLPRLFNAMWACQCGIFSLSVLEVACFEDYDE